jgi:tetratricopeptide (TPR) repeat protein
MAILLGGCGHYPEIQRLSNELTEEARLGRLDRASELEQRLRTLAAADYGPEGDCTFQLSAAIAFSYGSGGHLDRVRQIVESDLAVIESMHGPSNPRSVDARIALAWSLVVAGRWGEAEVVADGIERICAQLPGGHLDLPWSYYRTRCLDLAELYAAVGVSRKAVEFVLRSDAITRRPRTRQSGVLALARFGRWYARDGHYAEAQWYLRRCLDESSRWIRRRGRSAQAWQSRTRQISPHMIDSADGFDSQSPPCLEDLIHIENLLGNSSEAEALALAERNFWHNSPDVEGQLLASLRLTQDTRGSDGLIAYHENILAWYYRGKERSDEALAVWQGAARRLEQRLARYGRHRASGLATLHVDVLFGSGRILEEKSRLDEAEAGYRLAVKVAEEEFHPSHEWRLEALARLAGVARGTARADESEAAWRRYLEVAEQQRGTDHPDYVRGLDGLAAVHSDTRREDSARDLRRRADRIRHDYAARAASVRDLPLPIALRSPPSPDTDPPP